VKVGGQHTQQLLAIGLHLRGLDISVLSQRKCYVKPNYINAFKGQLCNRISIKWNILIKAKNPQAAQDSDKRFLFGHNNLSKTYLQLRTNTPVI
jgi:hypothetical protein